MINLKEIAKAVSPSFALPALKKINISLVEWRARFFNKPFNSWWNKFKFNSDLPRELIEMIDSFVISPDYHKLTAYWHFLNKKNIIQIANDRLENYRQTVSRNYFTWVGSSLENSYTRNLIRNSQKSNIKISLGQVLKKHDLFTLDQSFQYNLATAMLYDYVVSINGLGALKMLTESEIGNPPTMEIDGKLVSQDMLNSVIEYHSVTSQMKFGSRPHVMEIGAGSGRTAYCFLKLIPQAKYIIVDVPPALFISKYFLSKQFPNKKIFGFKTFNTYSEISDDFLSADIVFLMPHQLKLINSSIDLLMAIDCLHEMNASQVEYYFQQADRLAKNIYFKCWQNTRIPFDGIYWESNHYPVRAKWKKALYRETTVPSDFFEAFFNIY